MPIYKQYKLRYYPIFLLRVPPAASLNLRALVENRHHDDSDEGSNDQAREESDTRRNDQQPAGKKRKLATADFTRRKRAVTACQFCRLRKTKCDNVRPSCGYCLRHRAKCIYGDGESLEDNMEEVEQYDGIGKQILDQLKDIKEILSQSQNLNLHSSPSAGIAHDPVAVAGPGRYITPLAASAAISPDESSRISTDPNSWDQDGRTATQTIDSSTEVSDPTGRAHTLARCESILKWPVFVGIVSKDDSKIESFLMDSDYRLQHENGKAEIHPGFARQEVARGIPDDAFVPLCRKFLAHVHPRHPVLDADELVRFARAVEEHGVKWDTKSCLVLLACALAVYTVPWEAPVSPPKDVGSVQLRVQSIKEHRPESDAYYLAAKKRLGLLGHSIHDIQCLFLASMYEKYCLQPLHAWFHLREASSRLHSHLLGQRQQGRLEESTWSRHREQRVFWSCWRAETEILLEAGLPTSGLERLSYPNAFPIRPPDLSSSQQDIYIPGLEDVSNIHQRLIDEKGWCYYLAEISLRRAIDDTIQVLYQRGNYFWLNNQDSLVRHYHQFEEQTASWRKQLPGIVQFNEDQPNDTEFSYFLHVRFSEWHELVLRPIVYFVLNSPPENVKSDTIRHAQKSIDLSATLIVGMASQMRHGGSWFFARKAFLCACLILAVVLEPRRGIEPPQDWQALVRLSVRCLGFWGQDAVDINRMGMVLNYMYQAVCDRLLNSAQ